MPSAWTVKSCRVIFGLRLTSQPGVLRVPGWRSNPCEGDRTSQDRPAVSPGWCLPGGPALSTSTRCSQADPARAPRSGAPSVGRSAVHCTATNSSPELGLRGPAVPRTPPRGRSATGLPLQRRCGWEPQSGARRRQPIPFAGVSAYTQSCSHAGWRPAPPTSGRCTPPISGMTRAA